MGLGPQRPLIKSALGLCNRCDGHYGLLSSFVSGRWICEACEEDLRGALSIVEDSEEGGLSIAEDRGRLSRVNTDR